MSGMLLELLLAGSIVLLAVWELVRVSRTIKRCQQSRNSKQSVR